MLKRFKIGALAVIIAFLLLAVLILKSHIFQSFIINRFISPIEKKSNVGIEFEKSGFDIVDGFFLENLEIFDNTGSALLKLESFKISPRSTLLSLVKNDFGFNSIQLNGATVYINRKEDDPLSNWGSFVTSFQGDTSKTASKPIDFSIKEVEFEDLKLYIDDQHNKLQGEIELERFELSANLIDLNELEIDLNNVLLVKPRIDLVSCLIMSESEKEEEKEDEKNVNITSPSFLIKNLNLLGASVSYTSLNDILDDVFFKIDNGDLVVDDIRFEGIDNFSLRPRDISFKYNKSFSLDYFSTETISSIEGDLKVEDLIIRSNLGLMKASGVVTNEEGSLTGRLEDLTLDVDINNSFIDFHQLGSVLPGLSNQKWYDKSDIGKIFINGHLSGSLDDLSLLESQIVIPKLVTYAGDIDISNFENPESALINITMDQSKIHLDKINKRIPNIKIPDEVQRLGEVNITGQFDGFKDNFVAEAILKSELGELVFDLNFDISEDNQYSGLLDLNSFDLGVLLNAKDVGKISLSADITEGRGLELENIEATFSADIDTFQFKGYTYTNAIFNGQMSNKSVDGAFKVHDGTIDFDFDGRLDFSTDIPNAKFKIDINHIDLCQANLTNFPCEVSLNASIDMYGKELNDIQGTAILDSIFMKKDEEELYLDYLNISSTSVDQGMLLDVASDELDAKIRGKFDIRTMHKVLLSLLVSDYPDIAERLNVSSPSGLNGDEEFDFAIDVKDMNKVLDFVNSKQLLEIDGELRGRWSADKGLTSNSYNLRNIGLNGLKLSNVLFNLDSKEGDGSFSLYIDELLQGNRIIDGFEITSTIKESEIFFQVKNHDGQNDKIDISGSGNPWGNGFRFVFDHNLLRIDSVDWILDESAQIGYRDKEVSIDNFVLQGDNRTLILDDIMGKGISLLMKGFELSLINPIVDYDKMYFDGTTYIDIKAENLFGEREVSVDISVPDFTINNDSYGSIDIHATEGTNDMIDLSVRIEKDTQSLDVLAYYDLKESLLNADISILDYPMSIFEFIIDDGISGTIGTTDVNARIYGPISDLKLQGQGVIKNGGTRIDYIGEFYKMEDQVIKIDEKRVDLTGVELEDHQGNTAVITGGLNHNFLADFTADLSIYSPKFIGLNTTKEDNETYYGVGLGDIGVSFFGPFDEIDIKVDATTGGGSLLNIPLESSEFLLDKGFVNFDYKSDRDTSSRSNDPFEAIRLSGADFEMNLSFTPEADVRVIFDQSVDEVLAAKGSGDLRVTVKRDGTFEVFGNYLVESGDYLYSAYGITAKRFLLRRGGVVRWTGDPYNAILDVEADYTGMRAPLDIFLSEFIVSASESVKNEAKSRTDVALQLDLGGTLFQPDVNFDISFPNVTGELKTYTDNKMRSLRTTENGINNQVFGLMFFNNFLPSNNPLANISGSTLGQTGNNTITEFFSSQLSVLVSDALSDLIKDGTFINDIDFDIALSQNTSFLEGQGDGLIGGFVDFVPDQVGVNVRPSFKNDNWALNVGTNYVRASEANNVNYLTGDFALDWFITSDKKLKLRFYGDFDYDEAFASRKQRYGFGINYRREFGKMSDLSETLKKIAEDIRDQSGDK